MTILSIQSAVAYGHVGNAAAVFPLQRLGFEVWPVNTVYLSNHPGYGAWRGRGASAAEVAEVIDGIAERGVFAHCRAVLSGYLGCAETGPVVLDAVARIKAANAGALFCCDPVMGDGREGLYVPGELAAHLKNEVVPRADIVVPNVFELAFLAERPVETVEDAVAAARALIAAGPPVVVVTSVRGAGAPPDTIGALAVSRTQAWQVVTPRLPITVKGAGDVLAALFLGHYLERPDIGGALSRALSSVFGLVKATAAAGARELQLVAAQEEIVQPGEIFPARQVG
ncbi:MAG: pyridoxal kinase PdxY [Proteobacteria bacterium]|nr:pyridoxal kinase PdxY [Pseudomonadota bacterium]